MFLKTIIVVVTLTIIYSLFVSSGINEVKVKSFWQENIVKGEKLLFGEKKYTTVIIGSSLSARIQETMLPNSYNLGLIGCSIYDGFAVLRNMNSAKLPSTVLIETNYFLRDEKEFFVQKFHNNPYVLKRYLPAFRENYKPVLILASNLTKSLKPFLDSFHFCVRPNGSVNHNNYSFQKIISEEVINYKVKPDSTNLMNHVRKVQEFVSYLEAKNIKVIFFEMPVDESIRNLPKIVGIRNAVTKNFPNYKFIIPPVGYKVSPVDLEHLGKLDAQKFTTFLKQKIYDHNYAPTVYIQ